MRQLRQRLPGIAGETHWVVAWLPSTNDPALRALHPCMHADLHVHVH